MITPITNYSNKPAVLPCKTTFKSKSLTVKNVKNSELYQVFKNAAITVKLEEYVPLFKFVASLFGKELVYNDETGKLSAIKKVKKGVLQEVKHFYPSGKKVREIDEYSNGKLVKSSSYKLDGKTLDWTVDYLKDKIVTKFYYPDGGPKSIQTELNDGTNRMQIKRFNPQWYWYKTENYKDDILTSVQLYLNGKEVSSAYKDGKISRQITNFKKTPVKSFIPEGDQRKNPIHDYITDFDENEKPVKTIIHGTKANSELFVMGKMEYPDRDTIKLTRYKEDGKSLYEEIINKRTGKRTVTYLKG